MMKVLFPAVLLAALAIPLPAQQPPATLSLEDALELARRTNPGYRARLNDEGVAEWGVRSAYGALLPSAQVSGGLSYQGGGEALIGGFTADDIGIGETPPYYYSNYSVGVGLQLSGSTFHRLSQERATRRGVAAGIGAARLTLDAAVTRQYLSALRARDAVVLARQELERAEANLSLAEARQAVQSATGLETMQAEVERGRAEVELLRAEAAADTELLRLLQQIGLDLERGVELTTEVEVHEPRWSVEELLSMALSSHPRLAAGQATLQAAEAGVGMARSAYLPSLSLSAGISGYTRRAGSDEFLLDQAQTALEAQRQDCMTVNEILSRLDPPMPPQNCAAIRFTEEMRSAILEQNRQFPFNFETQPLSMSLGISIPVFQGLSRQRQLEAASAQAEDARLELRAEELAVRADVETSYLNLRAAHRAVELEDRNRTLASEQLRLARERYRVGAASFLELMEAETLRARADRAYLLGVYAFREALAALEAAVGRTLIPEE